jgi:uncharacterized protein YgiB involved in biofilm formation
MKRSKKIDLTIITILAASFIAGCNRNGAYDDDGNYVGDVKHCVDQNGTVVPESQCTQANGGGIGGHIPFRWYYGGSRVYSPGMRIGGGGSYSPMSGSSYTTPSAVSRGGFGSTGRSSSSFSSSGAGE